MTAAHQAIDTAGTPPLVFTDSAAIKVGELIREEGNPNLKLRVFVSGGGCSGFQYGFTFDGAPRPGHGWCSCRYQCRPPSRRPAHW